MSDRSHLTVSKPNPLNARQEAFARNIAEGHQPARSLPNALATPTCDNA